MSTTSSGEITAMKDDNAESAIAAPGEASGSRSSSTPSPSEAPKEQPDRSPNGSEAPPLPEEQPPPLPNEAPPNLVEDDGWAPVWDDNAQAFYFFNRFTNVSQWENPRVPEGAQPPSPGVGNYDRLGSANEAKPVAPATGGYDPAIHGDYDPNADYAKVYESSDIDGPSFDSATNLDPIQAYAATGTFNRFTGKWQAADLNPEKFNDENKSRRQMNAFFDVDAAANSHDGKSLKAERSGKKLSKKEVKAFKEKRREKKEEKRRAWLRD
jgi:hypothetical protein